MANATELVSLADLKSHLQITTTDKDAILTLIKNAVEALVKTYTGRNLLVSSYTEYHDGDDGSVLIVNQRPITEITSIHSDPARLYAGGSLIPSTDYPTDDAPDWAAGIVTLKDYRFLRGKKTTKIVYAAGLATIPADLAHATKLICAKEYFIQDKRMFGAVSQQVGDKVVTLELEAWPKSAIAILNLYRRFRVGI